MAVRTACRAQGKKNSQDLPWGTLRATFRPLRRDGHLTTFVRRSLRVNNRSGQPETFNQTFTQTLERALPPNNCQTN